MGDKPDGKPTALEQRRPLYESSELQQRIIQELVTPEAVMAIGAFLESPQLKELIAFQKALVGGVVEIIRKPEVQAGMTAFGAFLSSPQVGAALRAMNQLAVETERQVLPTLFDALVSERSAKPPRVVQAEGIASISIQAFGEARVITAAEQALERELVQKLESQKSRSLTTEQRAWVALVVAVFLAMWQALAEWNSVREGICDLGVRFGPAASLADVRREVRVRLCGAPAAYVRVVRRDNVNLRESPSMKADVIMQLPKGLPVAVVSTDNRDWLEVSFQRDGYVIEGWVSRKYLAKVP